MLLVVPTKHASDSGKASLECRVAPEPAAVIVARTNLRGNSRHPGTRRRNETRACRLKSWMACAIETKVPGDVGYAADPISVVDAYSRANPCS
jgi:hypothetical protein